MGAQHRLDLGGGDVLAAAADHVLLAPDEIHQTALVAADHVAGVIPAAAIGFRRYFRPAQITQVEIGAADQRLARRCLPARRVLVIDEPDG